MFKEVEDNKDYWHVVLTDAVPGIIKRKRHLFAWPTEFEGDGHTFIYPNVCKADAYVLAQAFNVGRLTIRDLVGEGICRGNLDSRKTSW